MDPKDTDTKAAPGTPPEAVVVVPPKPTKKPRGAAFDSRVFRTSTVEIMPSASAVTRTAKPEGVTPK